MKIMRFACASLALVLMLCVSPGVNRVRAQQAPVPNADMSPVKPESVGFSSERLDHLHALMQQVVDDKQISGIVTILARHGKIVDCRFAQMLANGGELDGVRVIAPSSVRLMTSNHVPTELLTGQFGIGLQTMRPGFGYGYDCAIEFDPPEANLSDGKGTFLWDGAAGTWFWVDPTNDIVFIGMIQRILAAGGPQLEYQSRSAVYGALVDPKM